MLYTQTMNTANAENRITEYEELKTFDMHKIYKSNVKFIFLLNMFCQGVILCRM